MKLYKSRIDWWVAVALLLPIAGGASTLLQGVVVDESGALWIGIVVLALYAVLLATMVLPMEYSIASDGLRVRSGLVRIHMPWDRVISGELSGNPLSSPALSLRRLNIAYRKPNGRETYVLISPVDREQFLRDMATYSQRHRLVDGKLLRT